jgi:long-chain fatty acid transport protein
MANGFRLVSQDAFAAARGEAFVATADNPSAVHYNPAGLTQLDGRQVRMGAYALHFEPTFTPLSGNDTYHIEEQDALAPQSYFSYSLPDYRLTLGLGIYAPHGASVTWPQDTGFRSVALMGELTYLRINPVVAYEVRPGLSIAAGVMVDYADLGLEQGISRRVTSNDYFRFSGDDIGLGYNFGATFRSAVSQNFDGVTDMEGRNILGTDIPASVKYEFPYTAVIGLSYRPTKEWNIELDADFSNWSSIDVVTIRQREEPPFPVQKVIPVNLGFEDSWMLKLGATRYFDDGWYASAGYVFNQNSVPDDYYSPVVADLDRHFLTFGVGRKWKKYTVDVAYQFGYGPNSTVTGSVPSSPTGTFAGQTADGTYDFLSHALLFSAGVRF